ncbi:hypothetical protein [Cellulosimicrobium sp. KWT-B]|uniref:hypothetical protein n=1 Tax=Cellulosimicrobium sp. KWT-B TaxID=1981152 RepID=UPI000A31ED0D|nr:hypothetical protein [Cellulosimicrobium sp. KWT-B]
MSRALDKARAAVATAQGELDRWTTALHDAEAAAAAAELAEPATPDDLDRIGQDATSASSRASAARRALATATVRLDVARRAALRAEADDETEAARSARKSYETHAGKVRALLDQLEKLDGIRYGNAPEHRGTGWRDHPGTSVSLDLYRRLCTHEARAAVLRFAAERGHAPMFVHELDTRPEGARLSDQVQGEQVPESVHAYAATTAQVLGAS